MKKVLFITYYWPPSGKASLHWPLKIMKHLPKYGWQPSVLTVEEDTFFQQDETLSEDISPDLKVIRTKSYEPFNIYKKFIGKKKDDQLVASETISKSNRSLSHRISIWLRMNLFILDERVGWYFLAVKAARKLIKDENIDAIVSVGPPHSTHLIGKKISKNLNIPHVPVFIDPWVDIIYYKDFKRSKITLSIDNHLEKTVLQNAKAIVFVTETMKNDYVKKYNFIEGKSNVLYWGYNEEDFERIIVKKEQKEEKVLVHAGNIFSYQNPPNFWKQIKKENERGNNIRIKFIGTVDPEIKKSITEEGLNEITEYCGFLPYNEMLKNISEADFLLVCASEPRHVPGKLFEYLRTGNPIIAFGNNNEEVKQILENSNAGMMFNYDESGEEFFSEYKTIKPKPEYVVRFDRKKISEELSKILDSITNNIF
ncbi:MAG: glycosyltransferase [Bacteroidetes bacterium]|nr:glycosyltransferase [Bacteroidota bacterium]